MYRYFVLVWNPHDSSAAALARSCATQLLAIPSEWGCVIDRPGLVALHAGVRPGSSETRPVQEDGALFGKVFTRGEEWASAPIILDSGDAAKIIATGGRQLLKDFWGRYVAVLRDPKTQAVHVFRDPTGSLPCFFTKYKNICVVFSDVEDCLRLPALRFTINWDYIAALVPYSALQIRATALNEVTEVQAGERVTFRGDAVSSEFLWHPIEVARQEPVESYEQAVVELKQTVRNCTQAWAASYAGILHNLSGGLDSSLILGCLQQAPSRTAVTCLTYFGSIRDHDERRYARLAAQRFQAELIECPLESSRVSLERVLTIKPSTRPWFYMYDLEHSELEARLARERGATAIFSGAGGDAVFFQARADLAVTDFLCRRGLRPQVFRVALDAARVMQTSIWPLLRRALRDRKRRQPWNPLEHLGHPQTLIEPRVVAAARTNPDLIHPWLTDTRGVPPGVVWHIASMCVPTAFYEPFGNAAAPERVFPLLSQPLVELCLRIPSYFTIVRGRDRSIARHAFAAELPHEIVKRRAKGAINHHIRNVLDHNIAFVRELLLDGLLVREKLLDRGRLEMYLSRDRSPADFEYNEIMQQHLCTEAWLRRWGDIARRAAA